MGGGDGIRLPPPPGPGIKIIPALRGLKENKMKQRENETKNRYGDLSPALQENIQIPQTK